jgi:outer membrane protein OmpA-like peptidoglycan-associated protein
MRRIAQHSWAATGAAAIVAGTAGCGAILTAPAASHLPTAPSTVTVQAAPSMLVVVTGPSGPGQLVSQVVTATARPREDLDVLEPGEPGRALIASTSPSPAKVAVPSRPAAPGRDASSYQEGQYQHALTRWQGQMAAGRRAVAVRTNAAVTRWAESLRLPVPATGPAGQQAATLPQDCSLAASTISGLVNQAGSRFRGRVVLLSVASISGMPPTGELDGDDVIVMTSYLPSAAAESAAQLDLLAAGASFAAVVGPEATQAQLDHLVSESLAGRVMSEVRSGQALFANNSATLHPAAARVLGRVLSELRPPGASGVVNGFASAPGSAHHNMVLSQERASAVAAYLEARGIARSSLVVVGHGASDLVAPGSSANNRRVVVVIEEPVGGGS